MGRLWHFSNFVTIVQEANVLLQSIVAQGLIDVVMIAHLLIRVIVGGGEIVASRPNLEGHPDQPEWLSHFDAGIHRTFVASALMLASRHNATSAAARLQRSPARAANRQRCVLERDARDR